VICGMFHPQTTTEPRIHDLGHHRGYYRKTIRCSHYSHAIAIHCRLQCRSDKEHAHAPSTSVRRDGEPTLRHEIECKRSAWLRVFASPSDDSQGPVPILQSRHMEGTFARFFLLCGFRGLRGRVSGAFSSMR